jgi:hypothetical protein
MRRMLLLFTVAAMMVAMMAMMAAPAMAKKGNNNGGTSFSSGSNNNGGISFNSGGSSFGFGGSGFSSFGSGDFDDNNGFDFGDSSFSSFDFGGSGFFEDEVEQVAVSGDFEADTGISLSGDNSSQCAPVAQFGNTGNNQNALSLTQGFSFAEDFAVEGGFISFEDVEFENSCVQSVEQATAA